MDSKSMITASYCEDRATNAGLKCPVTACRLSQVLQLLKHRFESTVLPQIHPCPNQALRLWHRSVSLKILELT